MPFYSGGGGGFTHLSYTMWIGRCSTSIDFGTDKNGCNGKQRLHYGACIRSYTSAFSVTFLHRSLSDEMPRFPNHEHPLPFDCVVFHGLYSFVHQFLSLHRTIILLSERVATNPNGQMVTIFRKTACELVIHHHVDARWETLDLISMCYTSPINTAFPGRGILSSDTSVNERVRLRIRPFTWEKRSVYDRMSPYYMAP